MNLNKLNCVNIQCWLYVLIYPMQFPDLFLLLTSYVIPVMARHIRVELPYLCSCSLLQVSCWECLSCCCSVEQQLTKWKKGPKGKISRTEIYWISYSYSKWVDLRAHFLDLLSLTVAPYHHLVESHQLIHLIFVLHNQLEYA